MVDADYELLSGGGQASAGAARPGRDRSQARRRSAVGVAAGREPRRALVTGITGQDGSFLAELLLEQGYEVTGMIRGPPTRAARRIRAPPGADRAGPTATCSTRPACSAAVARVRPDELYHLAAPSFVPDSWRRPGRDARRDRRRDRRRCSRRCATTSERTRVFVAGSGAMFGAAPESPQREDTPCRPGDARTRPPSSPRTSSSGSCAPTMACSPAPGSSTTTSPSADRSRSSPARSPAAAAAIKLGLGDERGPRRLGRGARLVIRRRRHARGVADAPAGPSPTTTSSPAGPATRSRSSPRWRSPTWA